MRAAAARASRFGLLLGLLLVLLGLSAAVAPGRGGPDPASVTAQSVSSSPTISDDLHTRLHLSAVARHTLSTAVPQTWWAVCTPDAGHTAVRRCSTVSDAPSAWTADAASASRSSRAPPHA
ncbi:hypothetical protein [Kibdelosporangium phytohabitans]|uniref:Uncharacterized protein n=1 Tax=Kibdelosporangium phytohabitans TaxID=860235 RepID=A0A0N7F3H2_9PSEU|nr:hypothetical protein [Kibdelosporangium phytohabitans]ALG08623.1 hypothetical protein AOZ06_18375 [Kibdelosporangium phytohabitans]MBE1470289.1 hypothetical protein [Kibdelosporangium phytohabitans]